MKTIKEGFLRKNLGLGKEELIKKWLDEHNIKKYTINNDLTIDVNGGVDLRGYEEKQLPEYIHFRKVTKYFYIGGCPNLETLKGCPQLIGRSFFCNRCPKLKSLDGGPQKVVGFFNCSICPKLKSLKGCPREVHGSFYCDGCGKQFTIDDVKKYCKVKLKIFI